MRSWLIDPSQRVIVEGDQLPDNYVVLHTEGGTIVQDNDTNTDDYFVIKGCPNPVRGKAVYMSHMDHDLDWIKSNIDFGTKVLIGGRAVFQGDFIFREIN